MPRYIIAIVLLATITGCANDASRFYYDAYVAHKNADQARMTNQAAAISESVARAKWSTPTEQALASIIAGLSIAQLKPDRFELERPKDGYDVAFQHAGVIVNGLTFGAGQYFLYDWLKSSEVMGGPTTYNTEGGSVTLENSHNMNEMHMTSSDNSTGSLAPMAVEPVVVEPVFAPEG
jgi:hypothetical protein